MIAGLVTLVALIPLVQLPIGNQAWNWARHELGTVTAKFEEDFVARHEIRNLGAADIQTKKFVDACWQRRRAKGYALRVQAVGTQMLIFVATMSQALVLWRTGTLTLEGTLTIGTALSVYLLVDTSTAPLRQIGVFYSALLEVRVSWGRLPRAVRGADPPGDPPDAVACPDLRGDVNFDHVAFVYPQTGRPVGPDMSLEVGPGEFRTVDLTAGPVGLGRGDFALVRTFEWLMVPNGVAVELTLKTSHAQQGYGSAAAVWLDPGWCGVGACRSATSRATLRCRSSAGCASPKSSSTPSTSPRCAPIGGGTRIGARRSTPRRAHRRSAGPFDDGHGDCERALASTPTTISIAADRGG